MKRLFPVLPSLLAMLMMAGCNSSDQKGTATTDSTGKTTSSDAKPTGLKPTGPKPAWGPSIDDEMQVVMDKLASYGDPPLETLSAPEARTKHTPTDAVMDVMKEHNIPMPPSMVDTMGKEIPVQGGSIHARIYTPKSGSGPFPLIVYYHGGGWVIATVDTYDGGARGLAEGAGAIVVSVEYRKGPEHKFPTAHNDGLCKTPLHLTPIQSWWRWPAKAPVATWPATSASWPEIKRFKCRCIRCWFIPSPTVT